MMLKITSSTPFPEGEPVELTEKIKEPRKQREPKTHVPTDEELQKQLSATTTWRNIEKISTAVYNFRLAEGLNVVASNLRRRIVEETDENKKTLLKILEGLTKEMLTDTIEVGIRLYGEKSS